MDIVFKRQNKLIIIIVFDDAIWKVDTPNCVRQRKQRCQWFSKDKLRGFAVLLSGEFGDKRLYNSAIVPDHKPKPSRKLEY